MKVKSVVIAVQGHNGFSKVWPDALQKHGSIVKKVNFYAGDSTDVLAECDALLWSINQDDINDLEFSRHFLQVADQLGLETFPSLNTRWHFDDKVAQSLLLKAVNLPIPDFWMFYDRQSVLSWLETAKFPFVFKLKAGAGSRNVVLVENRSQATRLIRRMFGKGIAPVSLIQNVGYAWKKNKRRGTTWRQLWKKAPNAFSKLLGNRKRNRHRSYFYAQEFIANNDKDYRVTIIGDRAFTYTRGVRKNDFRASGSGINTYLSEQQIDPGLIQLSFEAARRLDVPCMAFDFLRRCDTDEYVITEMCYEFISSYLANCQGFFDSALNWHSNTMAVEEYIVCDLLERLQKPCGV